MAPLLPLEELRERLRTIFPEGSPNRSHAMWDISARTVFVMLYVGAIEGTGVWIRPDQVGRMTDGQSEATDVAARRGGEVQIDVFASCCC